VANEISARVVVVVVAAPAVHQNLPPCAEKGSAK
jgi:hypothetical protein